MQSFKKVSAISSRARCQAYKVNQINVVLPTDIKKLKVEKGKDLVTLVTCTPYMINSHRLLVTGERVPYVTSKDKKVDAKSSESDIDAWVSENLVYAASLIVIIAGLGAILVLRKKKLKKIYRRYKTITMHFLKTQKNTSIHS